MFENISFAAPWVLGFLTTLPVIWWLLRLTPPAPRKIFFPAIELLRGLARDEQTPAKTPWWLLLLRLLAAALIIIAFAQPRLGPQTAGNGHGTLLIAIDNDWAAARAWDVRQQAMHDLIHAAENNDQPVMLLPTAAPADGSAIQIIGPMAAKAAYAEAERLKPMPWPSDWAQASAALQNSAQGIGATVWLAGGTGNTDAKNFAGLLHGINARVMLDAANPIYTLMPPQNDDAGTEVAVLRANTDDAAAINVNAVAEDGHTLAHLPLNFTAGAPRAVAPFDVPLDIRNQIARFEIEGQRTAAATILLDAGWKHRPVGLAGDRAELDRHSLLSGLFYLDRALKPYADLHVDPLDELLKQDMAVIVLTDATELNDTQIPALEAWVKHGGVLVRFAGEKMAAQQNPKETDLMPVALRTGDRAMGGSLSWATPQKLRNFPVNSPFSGLAVPEDVTVSRQILAEPSGDLGPHVWAALADGTPLVTAKPLGQGLSVLFHVPAQSNWSNLPLSGLFVDMLRRVLDLSHGNASIVDFSSLPPLTALDGFGETQKPGDAAQPMIENDFSKINVNPQHPPGLYGTDAVNRALNLGPALGQPEALRGVTTEPYQHNRTESDLEGIILALVFILMLADFVISLYMRGLVSLPRKLGAAALLLFFVMPSAHAATDAKSAIELTAKTTLAYVQTGNSETDHISEAGLTSLARVLQRRTSIDQIAVTGVNPDADDLAFFPLLYWPLSANALPLSPSGASRVNDYLHHGGMILFDTMTGEDMPPAVLQRLLANIDIPPLVKLPQDHVLKRSFYLLDDFPGRSDNPDFWLEPESMSSYDGVATVLIGSNGWAAAWATDTSGRFLYPCIPNGEPQRERAYRFGVNLVMYALTGNYKSDQLHAQALLERLGK